MCVDPCVEGPTLVGADEYGFGNKAGIDATTGGVFKVGASICTSSARVHYDHAQLIPNFGIGFARAAISLLARGGQERQLREVASNKVVLAQGLGHKPKETRRPFGVVTVLHKGKGVEAEYGPRRGRTAPT